MTVGVERAFVHIERFWQNVRQLAFSSRTIFELFFILLYAAEQVALVLLIEMYSSATALIVSLFAIIVLTTFALHKLVMESRIRLLEQQTSAIPAQSALMIAEADEIKRRYNELAEAYHQLQLEKQSLNMRKSNGGSTR